MKQSYLLGMILICLSGVTGCSTTPIIEQQKVEVIQEDILSRSDYLSMYDILENVAPQSALNKLLDLFQEYLEIPVYYNLIHDLGHIQQKKISSVTVGVRGMKENGIYVASGKSIFIKDEDE